MIRSHAGSAAWSWLRVAYVFAVVLAIGWALIRAGVDFGPVSRFLVLPQAVLMVVAWITMVLVLGLLWKAWLGWAEGARLVAREWLPVQAMAWAGRYLPGKVGLLMGKLAMARHPRLGVRAISLSVLVEQLSFVVSGACVALLLLDPTLLADGPWMPPGIEAHRWLWSSVGVLAAVCVLAVAVAMCARALSCGPSGLKAAKALALLLPHALPHLLVGLGFSALASAVYPELADVALAHKVAVLALAHVAGVLAVFAPAGIGVRELVLAVGLGGVLPMEDALLLAALLRVLTLIADGAVVALALLAWRFRE